MYAFECIATASLLRFSEFWFHIESLLKRFSVVICFLFIFFKEILQYQLFMRYTDEE